MAALKPKDRALLVELEELAGFEAASVITGGIITDALKLIRRLARHIDGLQLSSSPNDVKLLGMLTDAMSDLREAHEELELTQLDLVECQQQRDDLHRQLLEERDGFRATLRRYGIWVAG